MARSRPVYLYDRASGMPVVGFPDLSSAAAAAGKPADQISALARKPMETCNDWFAWSYDPQAGRRPPKPFTHQSRFLLVDVETGEYAGNLILFRMMDDVAKCLDTTYSRVRYAVRNGKPVSGKSNITPILAQDPRLAKVARWDPIRRFWYLTYRNERKIAGQ